MSAVHGGQPHGEPWSQEERQTVHDYGLRLEAQASVRLHEPLDPRTLKTHQDNESASVPTLSADGSEHKQASNLEKDVEPDQVQPIYVWHDIFFDP